jgi:hypothetical protein
LTVRVSFVLTAAACILPAFAQTTAGSIEGQTVNLKTGAPLRGATIYLVGPYAKTVLDPEDERMLTPVRGVSGDQGRFAFHNLVAGNYSLAADHDGFERGRFFTFHVATELLAVGEGQQVRDVILKLPPLGVIAGKVVDDQGKPLQNARITVYSYSEGIWRRQPQTGQSGGFGYTNDLGEYRAALRAGSYIVSAAYPFGVGRLEPDLTPGMGHPTLYYPNALGPDTARSLMVASGETVKAEFTLKRAPAYRISGYVTGPKGRIFDTACVGIVPKGTAPSNLLMVGSISTGGQDGSFTIVDVAPGSYTLAGCGGNPPVYGTQDVDVSGNIDGLKLRVAPGQPLRATIKVEDDASFSGARIYLVNPEGGRSEPLTSANSVVFDNVLPGLNYIPAVDRLPAGSYVKAVRYGGRDVPENGFALVEGQSLEVTISSLNAAQLTGSVTDDAGHPVRYPLVTVMPSDGGPIAAAKSVMGGADGKFAFQALRPGAYLAAAWQETMSPPNLGRDARILKLYRDKGKAVTVQPGPQPSLTINLIGAGEVDQARSNP